MIINFNMEWIETKKELPEIGIPVICYLPFADRYKIRELVRLIHNYSYYWDANRGNGMVLSHNLDGKEMVTHWMPLPAPPISR
jgi:hypothetical protein